MPATLPDLGRERASVIMFAVPAVRDAYALLDDALIALDREIAMSYALGPFNEPTIDTWLEQQKRNAETLRTQMREMRTSLTALSEPTA